MSKEKPKVEPAKHICPECKLDCHDEASFKRHMDWAHKPEPK